MVEVTNMMEKLNLNKTQGNKLAMIFCRESRQNDKAMQGQLLNCQQYFESKLACLGFKCEKTVQEVKSCSLKNFAKDILFEDLEEISSKSSNRKGSHLAFIIQDASRIGRSLDQANDFLHNNIFECHHSFEAISIHFVSENVVLVQSPKEEDDWSEQLEFFLESRYKKISHEYKAIKARFQQKADQLKKLGQTNMKVERFYCVIRDVNTKFGIKIKKAYINDQGEDILKLYNEMKDTHTQDQIVTEIAKIIDNKFGSSNFSMHGLKFGYWDVSQYLKDYDIYEDLFKPLQGKKYPLQRLSRRHILTAFKKEKNIQLVHKYRKIQKGVKQILDELVELEHKENEEQ